MRKYRFYKEWDYTDNNPNSNWFIDLKYFPFNKAYTAMVAGADLLLDKLAKGESEITLLVDSSPIPYNDGWIERNLKLGLAEGAIYDVHGIEIKHTLNTTIDRRDQLWLCPVTLWVFWKYPKKIYFKVDHTEVKDNKAKGSYSFESMFGTPSTIPNLRLI